MEVSDPFDLHSETFITGLIELPDIKAERECKQKKLSQRLLINSEKYFSET